MLADKMRNNLMEARKERNKVKETTFGNVVAKILVAEKSGKYSIPIEDSVVEEIIQKEVKELEETLSYYKDEKSPKRDELIQQQNILIEFLPKQLSKEEVIGIIKRLHESEPNKGKLIGMVCKEVGNKFDRSKVKPLVDEVIG